MLEGHTHIGKHTCIHTYTHIHIQTHTHANTFTNTYRWTRLADYFCWHVFARMTNWRLLSYNIAQYYNEPVKWNMAYSMSCLLDQCRNQKKLMFLVKLGYSLQRRWKPVMSPGLMTHTRKLVFTVLSQQDCHVLIPRWTVIIGPPSSDHWRDWFPEGPPYCFVVSATRVQAVFQLGSILIVTKLHKLFHLFTDAYKNTKHIM